MEFLRRHIFFKPFKVYNSIYRQRNTTHFIDRKKRPEISLYLKKWKITYDSMTLKNN